MSTMPAIDLLLVEDDERLRSSMSQRLQCGGFHVQEAQDASHAWDLAMRREFDVAVMDMVLPGMSGLELLGKLRDSSVECEVILLTGQASVESAVQAMKLGAYDYLTKPFPLDDLEKLISQAARQHTLAKRNRQLRTLVDRGRRERRLIGTSVAMQEVYRLVDRAGPSEKPILIQGESGTGKELVAWAMHEHSARAELPLVTINCAALPESLLESELFGHEKGSFTGADATKQGLFEVADGGTLFIDEIGEMPPTVQVKLLRVLEDGSLRRVGSLRERQVDVRLLSATNRNLERQIQYGQFREDLYYRISVLSLDLPPLRKRDGDVPLLANHFAGKGWRIDERAMALLENYHWPGNVRQLINVIERAKILSDDRVIRTADLPPALTDLADQQLVAVTGRTDELATIERAKILEILRREEGNKTRAARALGIERRKLYRLLEKYDIEDDELTDRSR